MLGHRSLQVVEKRRMINTGVVLHSCPFDSVPLRARLENAEEKVRKGDDKVTTSQEENFYLFIFFF